ncbi:MAG: PD-(D/E)XK nuclease family protein [Pirellulaceae bacterium]|nr:PD-(D/E)XK nuclease family protein [Pirellulaceae bacterium]
MEKQSNQSSPPPRHPSVTDFGERVFLGTHTPILASAAEVLISRYQTTNRLDLEKVLVLVPGSRARQRLLEILIEKSQRNHWFFRPPQLVTIGQFFENFYTPKRPFASELLQKFAWEKAIGQLTPDQLAPLIPSAKEAPPKATPSAEEEALSSSASEPFDRSELARWLFDSYQEITADDLDFWRISQKVNEWDDFPEKERWQTLATIQRHYHDLLDRLGWWDKQSARLYALEHPEELAMEHDLYLVGLVDLNGSVRRLLSLLQNQISTQRLPHTISFLLAAEKEWHDRFDSLGAVLPNQWQNRPLNLSPEQLHDAPTDENQAERVVEFLHSLGGKTPAEEISIALPNEDLAPQIEFQLNQLKVTTRNVNGTSLEETSLYRWLDACRNYLATDQFQHLAALLRHPHWFDYLQRHLPDIFKGSDWLTELDHFQTRQIAFRVDSRNHRATRLSDCQHCLEAIFFLVHEIFEPFYSKKQPLPLWQKAITDLLIRLYREHPFQKGDPQQRQMIYFCQQVQTILDELQTIPDELTPKVTGAQAISFLLAELKGQRLSPPADPQAVELVGWLEFPLDDAPVVLVTSFSEGTIPSLTVSDLLLPDSLRQRLGLLDNPRRQARDAYIIAVLQNCTQKLAFFYSERNQEGDPLMPSRFAFSVEQKKLPQRAKSLLTPSQEPTTRFAAPLFLSTKHDSDLWVPAPHPLEQPVDKMRVTSFRNYLACPYRFYLQDILRLRSINDTNQELSAGDFGNLLHDCLNDFGQSDFVTSAKAEQITDFLVSVLHRRYDKYYFRSAPAVKIQMYQIEKRLEAFAKWQARQQQEGWQIEFVEKEAETLFALPEGQSPMTIVGRIDRIDYHPEKNQWRVIDYKSSDTGKTPEAAHRKGRGDEGQWIDLQLPLYRHLVRSLGITENLELGYVNLPKKTDETGFYPAQTFVRRKPIPWGEDRFDEADTVATEVITDIRNEIFWPPNETSATLRTRFPDLATLCHDHAIRPSYQPQ